MLTFSSNNQKSSSNSYLKDTSSQHILSVLFCSLAICLVKPAMGQEALDWKGFDNLYKLNDSIYRSEQPSKKGFQMLEDAGIKTILNLRRLKDDANKAKGTHLVLEHLRLKSKEIDETDIIAALKIIQNSEKPVLVHCWHGSDRTGVVIAAYRLVIEGWTRKEALDEFQKPEFGYHENWYPNLLELLKALDVDKIRNELQLKGETN
jgi:protein tyrosine/serine phosphatase